MKIAIVGSGIAGLAAARGLRGQAELTLFEAGSHFGGHAHTVDVTLAGAQGRPVTHGVDTGFLVYNERTYPKLIKLFDALAVETAPSDMSFSVQVPGAFGPGALEWSGTSLSSVFTQRSNLLRPRFWRMLRDLLRFNALTSRIAQARIEDQMQQPLGDFLRAQGLSSEFTNWYLLPMLGCIWSCPTDQMLQFPLATMIRFCHNHGLIQITDRPQWRTVRGGSRNYVDRIVAHIPGRRLGCAVQRVQRDAQGVRVLSAAGWERFDKVVLAVHSDQALAMLADPSPLERGVLQAIRYQPNHAVLHTDASVLPSNRRAWAAWNYERGQDDQGQTPGVCLHYLLNRLQPLPWKQPVIVSLNPVRQPAAGRILGEYSYDHPVFDVAAIEAQQRLPMLQGRSNTYYCGAWTGYGFHEDGLSSGLAAARQLLVDTVRDTDPAMELAA